jgi:hypothetical protein
MSSSPQALRGCPECAMALTGLTSCMDIPRSRYCRDVDRPTTRRPTEFGRRLFAVALLVAVALSAIAEALPDDALRDDVLSARLDVDDKWSKETKSWLLLGGSAAFVTGWGVAKWNYGGRSPYARNEGWFGAHTKEGGADKLGHLHLSYAFANGMPAWYESWGFDADSAAKRAFWSTLSVMTYMELGDSFSDYGFSYEDAALNVVGVGAGYWLQRHRYWQDRIALRVEYLPSSLSADFFTDYERTKYVFALRADTLSNRSNARWLDLQMGYLARGYSTGVNTRREWFVGIGLNLQTLAEQFGLKKTGRVLHYWQPPGLSLQQRNQLEP